MTAVGEGQLRYAILPHGAEYSPLAKAAAAGQETQVRKLG
jgi:hypothetical protein